MNNKQTLWIITELFPPDETSTAYIMGEIANAMTSKYHVKVICGPDIYDKRKKLDENNKFRLHTSIDVFRAEGLDVDKNTKFGKCIGLLNISLKLYKIAKKKINNGDKVLLVTNPLPLIVLMAKLKGKIRFELNLLVHDVFPENAKPSNIRIPCLSLVKKIFAKSYGKTDMLIVLGRDMKDILKQKLSVHYSTNAGKPIIQIIENWADNSSIYPKTYCSKNAITIEYAGNIGRGQGLHLFLDNFVKANNPILHFELYGTGASADSLKQKVHNRGISNVRFHGPYFRSQQNYVLNQCNLALVTLADGMYGIGVPSKSYNIMAAGKAILFIGDLNSEIALTVQENNIGICFDSNNVEGLIDFLKNISIDSKNLFDEMGKRSRVLAETIYSKEYILSKFKNAL